MLSNYESYAEARERFVEACDAAGAELTSARHPLRGRANEPLHLDVARLGDPEGAAALVVASGTHGIEGYAGSAIQAALLDALRRRPALRGRLVLLHAVNPWGFAHSRRVNEDNVDVNRNFLEDFAHPPGNPHYDALADVIAPRVWSPETPAATRERFRRFRDEHGRPALDAAIMAGQYAHPTGMFFGGRRGTWSNRELRRRLPEALAGAERVAVLDLHTGLGPAGVASIVSNAPSASAEWRRTAAWWPGRASTTTAGASLSPHLAGSLKLALPELLPDAEVTAVTVELGTVPSRRVFEAMQAENWQHHHGEPDGEHAPSIRAAMREAFQPSAAEWRAAAWREARHVLGAAFHHLFGEDPP